MPIIKKRVILTYLFSIYLMCNSIIQAKDIFTIMIDPAGDAKHTGRLIHDTLERGISLQCAEQLKSKLVEKFSSIRVVLTRVPGETIQPLQNASFANRLDVNLYISLYFYHEQETPAHIALYYYIQDPIVDFWHQTDDLAFYSVSQAHLINLKTTKNWGMMMLEVLQNKNYSKYFQPIGLFAIPFTPLLGIKAPALAVEVGLKNKNDWHHVIEPLMLAIERIIA